MSKPEPFEDKVSADGSTAFPAEPGRYHLYVSPGCPFAHRTMMTRALKGLEDAIPMSFVAPILRNGGTEEYKGWDFTEEFPDPLELGVSNFLELYQKARADYPNKSLSVPVLWDKQTGTIVNNQSAQISEFFNSEFNAFATNADFDLNPPDLQEARQEFEAWALPGIAFAVYGVGFATDQQTYSERVPVLFQNLDRFDELLSKQRYALGDRITLSDVFMLAAIFRFDTAYHNLYRCNIRRIADYPNISGWLREMYQNPAIRSTVFVDDHIKVLYFNNPKLNPLGIVPLGPELDWDEPHDRDRFSS